MNWMAKRKLNKEDIFVATDSLLAEVGYEGFHFKPLAEKLHVGRSTIYEYYSSKDDLLIAYMHHIMNQFMDDHEKIDQTTSVKSQMKELIYLFIKHDRILMAIDLTPHVEKNGSEQVQHVLQQLWSYHHLIFQRIKNLVAEGRKTGEIRTDLPVSLIEMMLFQSISLNKARSQEALEEWAAAIYELLFNGIKKNES
ncbi:fatty acid degradation regulator YsiA, TetR family [Bacillus sp. JCM 19045]|nr:fatty acid degradation regulator YsiA, TetR family [Bacillus sp. JCM 19045]